MNARIVIITVIGSLALAASPAYAGAGGARHARQLEFVVLPDGASAAARAGRAPTAIARPAKAPWQAPNHSQVARNSF